MNKRDAAKANRVKAVAFRNFLGGSDVEEIKTDDLLDDMYLLLSRTLEDAS